MQVNIVVFKWDDTYQGVRIKSDMHRSSKPSKYNASHVNILYNSIKRNVTTPFNFICVTDDPRGIDKNVKIVSLWDKCRNLGGCLNRLFVFDRSMKDLLGQRFLCLDLDAVVVGNIDDILQRKEAFVINKFISKSKRPSQLYNGGLFLMSAGSKQSVWDSFNPSTSPQIIRKLHNENGQVGDDQTWIQHVLGNSESLFTKDDGVYDYNFLNPRDQLPENAKIVLFPGNVDPAIESSKIAWIKSHYRL